MVQKSLRDELLAGNTRQNQRSKIPLARIIVLCLAAMIVILFVMSQVLSPSDVPARLATTSQKAAPTESNASLDALPAQTNTFINTPLSVESNENDPSDAVSQKLDSLPVVSGQSLTGYNRDLFGQAWFDVNRNGCDTRNDILGRDLQDTVMKEGTGGCKVLSGLLNDWYSGTTVGFTSGQDTSRLVQIDHVVPLSWAWHHGADLWTDEMRREFANDPLNLVTTTEQMNLAKSDSGPSDWLPAADLAQCRYVQRFTEVLHEYGLGIDLRDRAMIRGILVECNNSDAFGSFAAGTEADGTSG